MRYKILKSSALIAVFSVIGFLSWSAYAALISPHIITIEDNQRSMQVILNNRGKIPKLYRFSWERRVLQPNGSLKLIEEGEPLPEGYAPADPYIRFSPRQVRVDPKTTQRVNFLIRRPADMAEGEYRSHFLVEEIPLAERKEDTLENPAGVSGMLKLRVNNSLPVLLRHGKTILSMDIAKAAVIHRDGEAIIDLLLHNNSTRTDYSSITLDCVTASGEEKNVLLTIARIYPNIKKYPMELSPGDFDLGQCQDMKVKVVASRFDPEFADKTIASAPVSR